MTKQSGTNQANDNWEWVGLVNFPRSVERLPLDRLVTLQAQLIEATRAVIGVCIHGLKASNALFETYSFLQAVEKTPNVLRVFAELTALPASQHFSLTFTALQMDDRERVLIYCAGADNLELARLLQKDVDELGRLLSLCLTGFEVVLKSARGGRVYQQLETRHRLLLSIYSALLDTYRTAVHQHQHHRLLVLEAIAKAKNT